MTERTVLPDAGEAHATFLELETATHGAVQRRAPRSFGVVVLEPAEER
jgi:hypothetical protein